MTPFAMPVDVSALFQLLTRRSVHILVIGILCGTLGGMLGAGRPLRYEASGLLIVDSSATESAGASARSTATDILRSPALLASAISSMSATEIATLTPAAHDPFGLKRFSGIFQVALHAVVAQFIPDHDKDTAVGSGRNLLVDYASDHLKVVGAETSKALSISFDAGRPQTAAAFVNHLMREYVVAEQTAKHNATLASDEELAQRVEDARAKVEAADVRVRDYQASNHLLMLQAGSTTALQLNAQQAELLTARVDLGNAKAALAANQSHTGGEQASREQQSSSVLQTLTARRTEVMQLLALMNDYGAAYPKHIALEQDLKVVQAQIDTEAGKITQSLVRDVEVAAKRFALLQDLTKQTETQAHANADAQLGLTQLSLQAEDRRSEYQVLRARLEQARTSAERLSTAYIASPATTPDKPQKGVTGITAVLGFLAGSLLAASTILVRQSLWPRVLSNQSLAFALGIPSIGSLPMISRARQPSMFDLAIDVANTPLSETLRRLRQSARAAVPSRNMVMLVTSAVAGEGKTTTAAAIARRAAADGMNVLLIEADLHRPGLSGITGLPPGLGLEAVLLDYEDLASALVIDPQSGLHCLLSSGGCTNPYRLLGSDRFFALLTEARQTYNLVVLDAPPTLEAAEAASLSRWSDIVMFVVHASKTPLSSVLEALRRMPENPRTKIMTVLTNAKDGPWQIRSSYGGYSAQDDARPGSRLADGRQSHDREPAVPNPEAFKNEQSLRLM